MKSKYTNSFTLFITFLLALGIGTVYLSKIKTERVVYANHRESEEDEHEDEEEEHDEDEHDNDDDNSSEDTYEYVEYVIYKGDEIPSTPEVVSVPVETYVTVIDSGYDIDTDGDGLVDAIDPNPNISEPLLFTDSDEDGVPDATDLYPGEDDFLYVQFEDANNNGILDLLEQ